MHLITRNVNTAFREIVEGIHTGKISTETSASRNGEVLRIPRPFTITYTHPRERVLFNAARDANPFFHLYEALWMLAGRNDVAPLAYYNSRISSYSDDGQTFNGAYGYRWRHAGGQLTTFNTAIGEMREWQSTDQLNVIVNHLKADPHSRRAVLSMWNVEDDLLKIGKIINPDSEGSKDVCCNLSAVFEVETGTCPECGGKGGVVYEGVQGDQAVCSVCKGYPHEQPRYLNMTVFNRSNDLIWGTLGANAVHFSILQEYLAARLDLDVGEYHQVSSNAHVYTNNWKPEEWLADPMPDFYTDADLSRVPFSEQVKLWGSMLRLRDLVMDPAAFDEEVGMFVERHRGSSSMMGYSEPFLANTAQPMCLAWHSYKNGNLDGAMQMAEVIGADDWRIACVAWLQRRIEKRKAQSAEKGRVE